MSEHTVYAMKIAAVANELSQARKLGIRAIDAGMELAGKLMETRQELSKVTEFAATGIVQLEKNYRAAEKEIDARGKRKVIGVLRTIAENFADNMTRSAADLAAKIHDKMDPRDDVVVVLGNCADAYKEMMLAVAQSLEDDLDWESRLSDSNCVGKS